MSVDLKRLAAAAADAALSEDRPAEPLGRSGNNGGHGAFRGLRGLAAGAVLVAAGRYAAKRAPSPMKLVAGRIPRPDFGELGERARDLIDDWFPEEDPGDDFEPEDEDYEEPEDADYEEPGAEADESENEDYDEPEVEADEPEEDEEPEDDEDDYVEPSERIDPAARPPKPPKRKQAKAG